MRGKPSSTYFLISQMIWPIGLATDKLYSVSHTGLITVFILGHQRKDSYWEYHLNCVWFNASKNEKNDE